MSGWEEVRARLEKASAGAGSKLKFATPVLCDDIRAVLDREKHLSSLCDTLRDDALTLQKRAERAEAELERLREALAFYADTRRYQGANQPYRDGDDPFTPAGSSFLIDAQRDNGSIARAALRGER